MTRINQLGKIRRFGWLSTAAMVGHGLNYYGRKHVLRRGRLVRRIHDYRMALDLQDRGLSKDIAIRGTREEQLKFILDREVRSGDVVLDLGANIGYYTLMLAKRVGGAGKVYAMEPEPGNFELLRENVRLNHVESIVETFQMGASDRAGTGMLHVSQRSNLHSFHGPDGRDGDPTGDVAKIEVPVIDVPTFIDGKRRIDLLRMDIEGYEVEVLSGLEPAIVDGRWTGRIVFECHYPRYDDGAHSIRKPLRMLFANGFHARYLTSSDEKRPKIRERGYQPIAALRTNDTRFRGIYENVSDADTESLMCDTGGVRDILLERAG